MNYWDWKSGNDICTQIVDGKIQKLIHNESEVENDDFDGNPFETKELSIDDFIKLVSATISDSYITIK